MKVAAGMGWAWPCQGTLQRAVPGIPKGLCRLPPWLPHARASRCLPPSPRALAMAGHQAPLLQPRPGSHIPSPVCFLPWRPTQRVQGATICASASVGLQDPFPGHRPQHPTLQHTAPLTPVRSPPPSYSAPCSNSETPSVAPILQSSPLAPSRQGRDPPWAHTTPPPTAPACPAPSSAAPSAAACRNENSSLPPCAVGRAMQRVRGEEAMAAAQGL